MKLLVAIIGLLLVLTGCYPVAWRGGPGWCWWRGYPFPLFVGWGGWFFWLLLIGLIILVYQLGKRRASSQLSSDIKEIKTRLVNKKR
ncbi:hypothetical protein [Desulfonauticus submarinus]